MTKTFAGRPVNGTVERYTPEMKPQRPVEEFAEALDAVLAFPEVESVRWTQYTPYFNDGEACVFGLHSREIKFVGDDEGGDDENGFHELWLSFPDGYFETHDWHGRCGRPKPDRADEVWQTKYVEEDGNAVSSELKAAGTVLGRAFESGEHDVALLGAFGDPAEVIATSGGFDVESYDHQ